MLRTHRASRNPRDRGRAAIVLFAPALVSALVLIRPAPTRAQGGCSGTESVLVELNSPMKYRANLASDEGPVLVQIGSLMTYRANSSDPGIGMTWTAKDFVEDGTWATGFYGVGYDSGSPNALALLGTPPVPTGTSSIFTRATFYLTDVSEVNNLFLGSDYDDGYAAWINGVEVFRSNEMPLGPLAWNTSATLHESSNGTTPSYGTLRDISFVIPYLVAGDNVLAVGVWNNAASSTDLVVVPKLSMAPNWTKKGYDDTGWSDGFYGVGYDTGTPSAAALFNTPQVPTGTSSVFTRAHFPIADKTAVTKMFLGADYDDGIVAWINGVEVLGSAETPYGPLAWNTNAQLHESSNGTTPNYGTLQDISARAIPALVNGDNVLAVGVWNSAAATSTDLVLVPRLSTGEAEPCDGVDNDCDGLVDEGFPNSDADVLADCVDPDDDNDGIADGFDCAPRDPTASAPPPHEVQSVLWKRNLVRTNVLTWTDQGFGVEYDLAGGLVSQLRPDAGVVNASCVADNLNAAVFDDPRPAPAATDGYYYMARAQKPMNDCGVGSYGLATSGMERLPSPLDCP